MAPIENPVIFTDLDGTLLDHDTYSWAPAAAVLSELKQRRIPVVLASSKTLAELAPLHDELELADPVIAENGAFIDVPPGYFTAELPVGTALPGRIDLQRIYLAVKRRHGFRCEAFFELGAARIAALTGLELPAARLANERFATEPVHWQDTPERLADFCADITSHGLQCVRGGRFVHIQGNIDKADALRRLMSAYRRDAGQQRRTSIALGDAPNDASMLAAADVAVLVRSRHDQEITLPQHRCVVRTEQAGPQGWGEAISRLLELNKSG